MVVDRDLTIRTFSPPDSLAGLFGESDTLGKPIDLLPWSHPRRVVAAVGLALQGMRHDFTGWRLFSHEFDGFVVPLNDDDGRFSGAIVVGADYSGFQDLHQALHHSYEATSCAHFVHDLDSMTVSVTHAFATMWGLHHVDAHVPFDTIVSRVHPEDRQTFIERHDPHTAKSKQVRIDFRIEHPERGVRTLRTHGSFVGDSFGTRQRVVGTVVDLTDHVTAQRTMEFLSKHDPLTGLWNRQVFIDALEHTTDNPREKIVLALIDLDRFAQINDIAGPQVGDELLRGVAERLKFLEHLGHLVARVGADEFACLLFDVEESSDADRIIESVHQRLDVPFGVNRTQYSVNSTIGVAVHPSDGSGHTLLQNAGIALMTAKHSARGSIVRYHEDFERTSSARSRMERDLSNAIQREQFEMFYQPLIDAATGEMIATEALLRWKHPELGLLTPDSFLNVAEESDHVVNIGRWAIERACRDAVRMNSSLRKNLRLNVNVSPRHVQSSALVTDVTAALEASGWEPSQLQLEVTEQLLISDIPTAASTLRQLRSQGVTVAIDDFGTGYNTLSHLKSYPVSCIKIDRAFVRDAESDDYSRAICRSVTALADSLDMNLIGEGVETYGQADFLKKIGCRELQGYHFGRPMAVGEFLAAHA